MLFNKGYCLPFKKGSCCSSTSLVIQYLDEPCDFLCFCFNDFLYGSSRSTKPDVLAGFRLPPYVGCGTTLVGWRLFDGVLKFEDGDDIIWFVSFDLILNNLGCLVSSLGLFALERESRTRIGWFSCKLIYFSNGWPLISVDEDCVSISKVR